MKTVKTLILVTALLVFATPARAGEAVQEEARQGATQEAPAADSDEPLAAVGSSDETVAASDENAIFEIGESERGPITNLYGCNELCTSGIGVCNAHCETVSGWRVCVGDGNVCCLVNC